MGRICIRILENAKCDSLVDVGERGPLVGRNLAKADRKSAREAVRPSPLSAAYELGKASIRGGIANRDSSDGVGAASDMAIDNDETNPPANRVSC